MKLIAKLSVLGICVMLAACGTTPGDRAISGGALGAASGAVIGAVAGGPILGAALIGGAAGAAVGAFSNPHMIDLGPVPWHQ